MLTKRDWVMLGRIFEAEMYSKLPFQSRDKAYSRLKEDGLVVEIERQLDGRFPLTIKGWGLTLLGHWSYCAHCDKFEPKLNSK